MKQRILAPLAALVCLLCLTGCGPKDYGPPPDLTGKWQQPDATEWYFIGKIEDDIIQIDWYLPSTGRAYLYWKGTFTPPENGKEPYSWKSTTLYTEEELDASHLFNRATREEHKTFTYKDGKLGFIVTSGHLQMGYTMERVEDYNTGVNSQADG